MSLKEVFLGTLKGDFLLKDNAKKNWKWIFTIIGTSFVMITCSHQTDAKIFEIAELSKEIKVLKAEYIDSAIKVTKLKMESTIKPKVLKDSLFAPENPPTKITVR